MPDCIVTLVEGNDNDVEGGDGHRPDDTLVVVMLLDDGGQCTPDANAVAPHEIRFLAAIFVDIVGMKRDRVLRTELERVTDFDTCGRMQRMAAYGANVPCPDGPYVCHDGRVKVVPKEGIPDVEPISAGSDGI